MQINKKYIIFTLATILNLILLIYDANKLSISFNEAEIFYKSGSFFSENYFLHNILIISTTIFKPLLGQDLAIRLPFLLVHFLNIILIYHVSKNISKNETQGIISACIFMYLPGVLASAIIINPAAFLILISLGAVLLVQNSRFLLLILLIFISIFISKYFIILYFALFCFGLYTKNKQYISLGSIFCIIWIFIFEVNFSGKPKGYIIDTMAIFGAAFSPFIFIYFIYSFYRIWIKENKDFLWFITTISFCFCLIYSIREKVALQSFLPFCVIFIPHMVNLFFISYNVRLPQFRLKYKILAGLLISSLAVNAFMSFFYDFLYAFLSKPERHFAYKYDIAKELANELHKYNITEVWAPYELSQRLKFYNINSSKDKFLTKEECLTNQKQIINFYIKKANKKIIEFHICE